MENKERMSSFTSSAAKSLQSCPTLCDPIDVSPPGSPAPGILQARTLFEVLAICPIERLISYDITYMWKHMIQINLFTKQRNSQT